MRKIIYIFLIMIFISHQVKGSDLEGWSVYLGWGAIITAGAISHFYTYPERPGQGVYLSAGLDPAMLIRENTLNTRYKLSYLIGRFEPALIYENAPDPFFYNGLSTAVNYLFINRKISLLSGVETTRIYNKGHAPAWSFGINGELRYIINQRLSLSYAGNLKTRPELKGKSIVYNGYVTVNLLISKR